MRKYIVFSCFIYLLTLLAQAGCDQYASDVKRKAEQGDAEAQNLLANWYENGVSGVTKDYAKAVEWHLKAAERGNISSQSRLIRLSQGDNASLYDPDANQVGAWICEAAEQGNIWAEDLLSRMGFGYFYGIGVPQDYVKAAYWFTKAAQQENIIAQSYMGVAYDLGLGVSKDSTKALEWWQKAEKAAERADVEKLFDVGKGYLYGMDLPQQNYAKAVYWLTKAAERNHDYAQYILGDMYADGTGVQKDEFKAAQWYKKSAEQGNSSAQCALGYMYARGQGVPKNYFDAARWYKKSAEQGNRRGQLSLGLAHLKGQGVIRDKKEGCELIRAATEEGFMLAIEAYNELCAD